MLTCRELAHRHASDYLDGQLGWRARLGVRVHLAICGHCRRFVAQLRKVRLLLRDKPQSDFGIDPAAQELGVRLASVYATQKSQAPQKKPSPL